MAGKQTSGDLAARPLVDASSVRLTSLRTSTDASIAPARKPKFVPKAVKRRPVEVNEKITSISSQRIHDTKTRPTGAGGLKSDNRERGGRGYRGGGRGRGRGRGRGIFASGKVSFVGTLSGGSSFSGGGSTSAPRSMPSTDYSAAGGTGISVLDEELLGKNMPDIDVEEVWPPVIKSIMEPMSLPIVRPPEPEKAGAVFCDAAGDLLVSDDSLFFFQMPTTLPLSRTVLKSRNSTDSTAEDESVQSLEVSKEQAQKLEDGVNPDEISDDGVFDHSIATAPGGFIGKLCVHKSGKMVLMLSDKQFEVAIAQTPSFCEEVFAINTVEKRLSILGNVKRHLVVTPDFEVLLH